MIRLVKTLLVSKHGGLLLQHESDIQTDLISSVLHDDIGLLILVLTQSHQHNVTLCTAWSARNAFNAGTPPT